MAKRVRISENPSVYIVPISSYSTSRSFRTTLDTCPDSSETQETCCSRSVESIDAETICNSVEDVNQVEDDGIVEEVSVESISRITAAAYGEVDSVVSSDEVTLEWVETMLSGPDHSLVEVVTSRHDVNSAKDTSQRSCQDMQLDASRKIGGAVTSQTENGSGETSPPSLNRGLIGSVTTDDVGTAEDELLSSAWTSKHLDAGSLEASSTQADHMSNKAMFLKAERSSDARYTQSSDASNYLNETIPRFTGGDSESRKGSRKSSLKSSKRESASSRRSSVVSMSKVVSVVEVKEEIPQIKFDPEKPFSDDCERFQQECPCCHCVAVRSAIKKATYFVTPEGQKRLQMKRDVKNFFMDINAMSRVRWGIQAKLYGTKEPYPCPLTAFPIGITSVRRVDDRCLAISWYVHDDDSVGHYEILIDGKLKKRIYNPQQTSAILLDVVACCPHKIIMRTFPRNDINLSESDALIKILCLFGMNKVLNICKPTASTPAGTKKKCLCEEMNTVEEEEPVEEEKPKGEQNSKQNARQNLMEFWKPSEYIYMPCNCKKECFCDWTN